MDEKLRALTVYALSKFMEDLGRRLSQIENLKADQWLTSQIGQSFDPKVLGYLGSTAESLSKTQSEVAAAIKFIGELNK